MLLYSYGPWADCLIAVKIDWAFKRDRISHLLKTLKEYSLLAHKTNREYYLNSYSTHITQRCPLFIFSL